MTTAPAAQGPWDRRHRGREVALQTLYQMAVGRLDPVHAIALLGEVREDDAEPLDDETSAFASVLAQGTWDARAALDGILEPHCTNWRLDRLAAIDHLILRMAVHEWLTIPATPPRVVLSEALELAREYSGDAAVRFVNGVLDAVYRQLRGEGRIIE